MPQPPSIQDYSKSLSEEIRTRLSNLQLLLMDVDGVLTDGRVIMADDGVESKQFSTRDGFGLFWIRKTGVKTGVISGRSSPATEQRCKNLRLDEIHLGQTKKLPVFESIVRKMSLNPMHIAFIGDDLIDLPVMKRCGISACPMDAHEEVLRHVDIILPAPGGHGAARYFVDLYLHAAGHWDSSIKDILNDNY
ncbi:HAD hydrolase family protein [bacterium]|nr:HAD hydrolase family protein [bacterium]MBU1637431.1 HAD hydrolase family protein [bacterium]MBU1919364.1 HAD hydrolase family protein [bacterium]